MGSTSVRRNLFHQNLSRRPASADSTTGVLSHGSATTTTNTSTSGLSTRPTHRMKPASSDSSSSTRSIKMAENKEIVVRDKNGAYKLDTPALPHALIGEDGEDGEELGDLNGEATGATGLDASELSGRDNEKLEAALVEMMIRHRNRQSSGEPDEILTIVHQSLRKKVASLEEDNWMFEPEKEARF